jgi:ribosomal protein S18 acetylase RimI-like enzyme
MNLRLANASDLPALLQLTGDCVTAMRAVGIEQWDEVYPNAEVFSTDIAAGTLTVLEEDGSLIAAITIDSHHDPMWSDLAWTGESDSAMAVHRLMVHPAQQGRGIAKHLMQHAEIIAGAKGARSVRLDSFLQNPAASALYPRLGYQATGIVMMRKGEFMGFEKLL